MTKMKSQQVESWLSRYSTVVLADIQQYGERAAAIAAAEALRARGVMVTAVQVQACMADAIVMPLSSREVDLIMQEAV